MQLSVSILYWHGRVFFNIPVQMVCLGASDDEITTKMLPEHDALFWNSMQLK